MKRILLLIIPLLFSTTINAQGWGQTQKIVPDDRSQSQQFGSDVDIDGNFAVVGMLPSANETNVYIFENDGSGNWIQVQKLESPDYNQFDHFGYSVAISGDYIFVGAWGEDRDATNSNFLQAAGAVYVFQKQPSGLFDFVQKIVASDRETLNAFGYTVAVDGDYALVSPVRHDYDETGNNFLDDAGAAYIFELDSGGTWNEVQKIVASDRAAFDYFGQLAIAVNGNYIAIGSYGEDEDENGTNLILSAGSAYIFERGTNGIWSETQKIVASDRSQGVFFGWSIGVNGNQVVVGSNQDNEFRGAAYTFERNANGIWNQTQKLIASNAFPGDRFGQDVDIDGNRIVVGSHLKHIGSQGDDGAAYIFEDKAGVWTETAFIYDAFYKSSEYFGFTVAISGDFAFVGAYGDEEDENEENNLNGAGAAFMFDVNEPNTLSVVKSDFESIIKAYPNPVQNVLNLDLGRYYDNTRLHVYNILGQEVFSKNYNNSRIIEVEFYNQSKGLYIVELALENQIHSRVKVTKQ
ncbi:T9SS type A sorting domain-containing protein [Winogradskyella schleiferi]|uniref:T9SS type A sorting domain-containing protein n=1 Tax=Winogradskyella schleiferi TaxID=2686078 RepID=UPI0015BA5522|nr:T9SS type A sorting domain-containing protein [Winogradskyella schleiferi]